VRHDEVGEALDDLYWVRDRVLAATAGLTDEQFLLEDTVTSRSLRATLVHQLECEWAWRIRLGQGSFPASGLLPEAFVRVRVLSERWRQEEAELRSWLTASPKPIWPVCRLLIGPAPWPRGATSSTW
jgi:uncharacterized damage-inducible protein DinB